MLDSSMNKILLIALQACDEHVGKVLPLLLFFCLFHSWAP
jgi:hypothetical protein